MIVLYNCINKNPNHKNLYYITVHVFLQLCCHLQRTPNTFNTRRGQHSCRNTRIRNKVSIFVIREFIQIIIIIM